MSKQLDHNRTRLKINIVDGVPVKCFGEYIITDGDLSESPKIKEIENVDYNKNSNNFWNDVISDIKNIEGII